MTSASLLGCWVLNGSPNGIDAGERVEMKLEPSRRMIYGVLENGRWQLMILSYRVEGNLIISNQPSTPGEERTEFSFSGPDTLNLEQPGNVSSFRRIQSCSFSVPEKRGILERMGFRKK